MLNWLNSTAMTLLGETASWAEVLGFVTGLACVWLVVRQHIANWPVGIVNVLLLIVPFVAAGLYSDAALQVVYVVLGFYGWWRWHAHGATAGAAVRRTTGREWVLIVVAGVAATGLLYWLLRTALSSTVPFADAVTTALSLVATFGQCRKLVENWWFWIVADVVYVPLYLYKGLDLTAVLYVVFLALAVTGLLAWRRDLAAAPPVPVAA